MKRIVLSALSIFLITASGNAFANPEKYCHYGKVYYKQKNYTNAKAYLQAGLKHFPDDHDCRYYLANALVYLGDFDGAKKEYNYITKYGRGTPAAKYSYKALSNLKYPSRATSAGSQENYIYNAINPNGKKVLWSKAKMPLKIYYQQIPNNVYFKPEYKNQVEMAFGNWSNASDGNISFIKTSSPQVADIVVEFTNSLGKSSTGYTTFGLTHYKYSGGHLTFVKLQLATKPGLAPLSEVHVYNTALHEIGHALGIAGHSTDQNDIMSTYNAKDERFLLSNRDKNTVKSLYSDETIIDNQKVIEKKREEAREFTDKIPDNPQAWINLADTYFSGKKYDDAIALYKKALTLLPKSEAAIYGLVQCYWKKGYFYQANKYFSLLTKTYPNNANYQHGHAFMCYDLKKYDEAKEELEVLYKKFPNMKTNPQVQNLEKAITAALNDSN